MTGDPLAVHDVKVEDVPRFNGTGQTVVVTRVTFYVGAHGPFVREFAPGQATASSIQAAFDAQVSMLRALQYGSQPQP